MTPGPFEKEARAFLGERMHGIPESQYLFSLAELVRTREKFFKASQRVAPDSWEQIAPSPEGPS